MCTFGKCCEQNPCRDCTKVNNTAVKIPHKHAAVIKAWADGVKIQARSPSTGVWRDIANPLWHFNSEYRIKPEPKPEIIRFLSIRLVENKVCLMHPSDCPDNIKVKFDGETGELKSVEKI